MSRRAYPAPGGSISASRTNPRALRFTKGTSSRSAAVALRQLRVHDPAVSSLHCRLRVVGFGIFVEDLASKNGLYVGGARVSSALLSESGAAFVVGRSAMCLRTVERDEDEQPSDPLPGVIGSSAPMLRVARLVRRHAKSRVPILLQGESGTGKDMVARAVHELGRRNGPYVPLNMAALPESLADAELFGHRRGAFTGAVSSRVGAFEQAHEGTLFLDEIAELPLSIQVKLLRVVEDGMVRAVGAAQALAGRRCGLVSASWARARRASPWRAAFGRTCIIAWRPSWSSCHRFASGAATSRS